MPRTRRCRTFGAIGKAVSKQASAAASSRPQVLTHQGSRTPSFPACLMWSKRAAQGSVRSPLRVLGTCFRLSGPVTQIRGSASGVDACHGMPRPYHQNSTGSLLPV
ncbi:hypothetical protein BO79DRAFT_206020 [Aspergillus costaricaensis CBS 115574]|uniref:Uncharacterized protein n=1 Tax=Aspergillus costaricaensis CBS 115574 TaxID=1448317 RepID=A0ACD1IVG9_9EURO|nr:hypothetical protein BO79DRAFT_206020 [Aspergillus costaricaensis CBS 115574]RAK94129.1 hypothetical protein BO79DRAFT_206020 [Aspergillus costaricaensis CBS 115574]